MSDIAPERFAFHIRDPQSNWMIVLDEVWEPLSKDPPSVWAISIRELPEEREQREFLLTLYQVEWLGHDDASVYEDSVLPPARKTGFLELMIQVLSWRNVIVVAGNINC